MTVIRIVWCFYENEACARDVSNPDGQRSDYHKAEYLLSTCLFHAFILHEHWGTLLFIKLWFYRFIKYYTDK